MSEPIPMLLWCPSCHVRHHDVGEFAAKPHHTHACQHCGMVWRPAIVPTVGVEFLPGFKNQAPPPPQRIRRSLLARLETMGVPGLVVTAEYAALRLEAPIESVRAALSKAVRRGTVKRIKVGTYSLVGVAGAAADGRSNT